MGKINTNDESGDRYHVPLSPVLYRNGQEVAAPGATKHTVQKAEDRYLVTYGTFGPLLGAAIDAIAVPGGLTWVRWEHGEGGPHAVFRYVVPAEKSHYQVGGCCLPGGDGKVPFQKLTGYHGEIEMDPASGAILRLTVEADLKSATPLVRSDIMIEYDPIDIGEKCISALREAYLFRERDL